MVVRVVMGERQGGLTAKMGISTNNMKLQRYSPQGGGRCVD